MAFLHQNSSDLVKYLVTLNENDEEGDTGIITVKAAKLQIKNYSTLIKSSIEGSHYL